MITVPKHRIHIVPTTMRNLVVVLSLLPFPFVFVGSTIFCLLLTLTRKEKNEVENEEIAKKLFV